MSGVPPQGPARNRSRDPVNPSRAYGSFPAPDPETGEQAAAAKDQESRPDDLEGLGPMMSRLEGFGLFRSESMEMSNDPRFFQGSILNKRLAAFSGLGVVSGLMVGFTQTSVRNVTNMDFTTIEGSLQGATFIISCIALFANIIATYVSVAQVYHVYRLETAGPTGFEMATSYYLNPNIVAWRHLAIKCLLLSLPLFLVSTGLQIEVAMATKASTPRRPTLAMARACGMSIMGVYCVMGAVVWYIHSIHAWIFRDRYEVAMDHQSPYLSRVHSMMAPGRQRSRASQLDV